VSNVWVPRPYGDPVFKAARALEVNEILREPQVCEVAFFLVDSALILQQVDPLYEPVKEELLSEEYIHFMLGRHVETAVEAISSVIRIHEHVNSEHIIEVRATEMIDIKVQLTQGAVELHSGSFAGDAIDSCREES